MNRISGAILASALAGMIAAPAAAQDIKLYLKDGTEIGRYEKSYALVIGINDYRFHQSLNEAKNDARKIAAALDEEFEVVSYYEQPLTGQQIREVVEDFIQTYGYLENARVLIWFAGHGMTVDGEGYLLGTDAPILDKSSETLDQDLKRFYDASMSVRLFGVYLRQMRTRHVMVVLDSCFAGTIFKNTRAPGSRELSSEMGQPTRQIITAGLAGEEVDDNGHFASMFIRAIGGEPGPQGQIADQNGDFYLTGTELGSFLYSTARTTKQTPQQGKLRQEIGSDLLSSTDAFLTEHANYERGEFFFVLPGRPEPGLETVASAGQEQSVEPPQGVIWRELASGTRIANVKPDPVPVFAGTPTSVGEKTFELSPGQQFPPADAAVVLEYATVAGEKWLRFERDETYHYVLEEDVEIFRP